VMYIGALLLAFLSSVTEMHQAVVPLTTLAMLGAVAQLFFSYEDVRTLDSIKENEYQLQRTKRLLNENFQNVKKFRFISLILGGVFMPLLAVVFVSLSLSATIMTLLLALLVVFVSELSDRFLFYSTVVPLGMAGGFFVGKQRY